REPARPAAERLAHQDRLALEAASLGADQHGDVARRVVEVALDHAVFSSTRSSWVVSWVQSTSMSCHCTARRSVAARPGVRRPKIGSYLKIGRASCRERV